MLHRAPAFEIDVDGRRAERRSMQQAPAELVPRDGHPLRPIAEMPRDVMEHPHNLGGAAARRREGLERVVALIRIERAVLAAEHRLEIDEDSRPSAHVVDEVEGSAEVRVPGESLVRDSLRADRRGQQRGRRQMKIVTGEELGRRRPGTDDRLLRRGASGDDERQAGGEDRPPDQRSVDVWHAASLSSSSTLAVVSTN